VEFTGNLNGKSDFKANGENLENAGIEAEINQKDNSDTQGDEYAPAASAKLGKPKSSAKNIMAEKILDESTAEKANTTSSSEKNALELQAESTARSLLKMGLDCEKISVATGLPLERVKEIQNDIQEEIKSGKNAK